jgi:hypothetical protein
MNPILPLANNNLLNNHMHTLLFFMRFGFTFLISLIFRIIEPGHSIMFVKCHCIKLKLVLGLQCLEGELLDQSCLMQLSRY